MLSKVSFQKYNIVLTGLVLSLLIIAYLFLEMKSLKNLNLIEREEVNQLAQTVVVLEEQVDYLNKRLVEEAEVQYYIGKLKDREFTGVYGEGYTWYIAAEELGKIGKPAIPYLIKNLETKDDYETALTLYALLLATQHENVKEFAGHNYIATALDFNIDRHEEMKEIAFMWWERYQHNWD